MSNKVDYKGEEITLDLSSGKWKWNEFSDDSLNKLKGIIDRTKQEQWVDVTAIRAIHAGGSDAHKVKVTSRVSGSNNQYWISWKALGTRVRREKISGHYLKADTPENWKIVKQIIALEKQQDALGRQMVKLGEKLKHFTEPQPKKEKVKKGQLEKETNNDGNEGDVV